MSIFLVLALLLGGGTSFAAQSSLPGDTLYPVKVNVNENVRSFLTFGGQNSANVEADAAINRLEEAEELAASGELNAEARAEIKANFEKHAAKVKDRIAEFEANGDLKAAAEVSSQFESSLRAHQAILIRIKNQDAKVKGDVDDILEVVITGLAENSAARTRAETKISVFGSVEAEAAANGALTASVNKIDEVKKYLANNSDKFTADAKANADLTVATADSLVLQGKEKLEAKAYGEAFLFFKEAHRKAQTAKLEMTGDTRLKISGGGVIKIDTNSQTQTTSGNGSGTLDVKTNTNVETNTKTQGSSSETQGSLKIDVGL